MNAATFADEVDVAASHVQAGALLLQLVAQGLGKGDPGLDAAAPQILAKYQAM